MCRTPFPGRAPYGSLSKIAHEGFVTKADSAKSHHYVTEFRTATPPDNFPVGFWAGFKGDWPTVLSGPGALSARLCCDLGRRELLNSGSAEQSSTSKIRRRGCIIMG